MAGPWERYAAAGPESETAGPWTRYQGGASQSWGDYAAGLARQAAQGLTFSTADEIEAWLRSRGGGDYNREVARIRQENERFAQENPGASFTANLVGGIPTFAAGPLAGAARWVGAASTMPRAIARSGVLGAGVGAGSGFGAGEGNPLEGDLGRLYSAGVGAGLGAGIGTIAPPLIAGGARGVDYLSRAISPRSALGARASEMPPGPPPVPPQTGRTPPPVGGATFIDLPGEGAIGAQDGAIRLIADELVRAGRTPAQAQTRIAQVLEAHRLNPNSEALNVTTLVELFPELQRTLGAATRAYPEVANDAAQFFYGRQTGLTPPGANAVALAERGIPTRARFAKAETGTESGRRLGREFVAQPSETIVPAGAQARIHDMMKRSLLLKDTDYHGHAANPMRTSEQILAAQKAESKPAYDLTYRLGRNVDLRPTVRPVMERWAQRIAPGPDGEPSAVGREIQRAMRQFYTQGGRDAQLVGNIQRFDKAKQFLDGVIDGFYNSADGRNRYVAGILSEFKNELLDALKNSTDARTKVVARAYERARGIFSDRARSLEIMESFRNAWKGESAAGIDAYNALSSDGERKLARLGLLWGYEDATKGTDFGRQVASVFNNPRVNELIAHIGPRSERSGATFANRPERLGELIDLENAGTRSRDVALGGSQTAKNMMDDMALGAAEAFQHMRSALSVFRGSTSVWDLGSRVLERIIDRSFGLSADRARELSRMLLTADQNEIAMIMRRVASAMPANRMDRFTELMRQIQRYAAPGAAASANVSAQAPSGPAFL